MKGKHFVHQVLVTMMDVEKTPTINVTAPVMESSMRDENRCGETLSAVVEKLLHPCLDRLVNCVTTARYINAYSEFDCFT